jgi:hypothetical protein
MSDPAKILDFHRFLLADKVREAFRRSIFQYVKPGDTVVDLGAGTGILAYFACQAGARRVYAVEMGEVINFAEDICLKNGFQDKVIFFQDRSTRVDLPERADVLVTDTFDSFGIDGGILETIIDARERFLKPDAVIIPQSLELFGAPIELPELYERKIEFWSKDIYGINFSSLRRFAFNNLYSVRAGRDALLGAAASLAKIDLSTVSTSELFGETTLVVTRRGVMHGIVGWFATQLMQAIRLSNAPDGEDTHYAQVFLPLEQAVQLEEGDRLSITIHSYNGSAWRWRVDVQSRLNAEENASEQKSHFDQSTFWGFPLSKEEFRKRSSTFTPRLSEQGAAELFVLRLFDEQRALGEIEKDLLRQFPSIFHSSRDAEVFVRELIARCT